MIEINISNTYSSTIELNDELINQGSLRANEFFITAEFAKTYEELTRYVCTFNFRRNDNVEINGLVATPVMRNSKWGWYYNISSKDITALDGDLHLTIKLNNLNEDEVITTTSFTLHVEHNAIGEEQVLINDAQYNALLDKFNLYYTKDAVDNLVHSIDITDTYNGFNFDYSAETGLLTITMIDKAGNETTKTVTIFSDTDKYITSVVYEETSKQFVFTFNNGDTITCPFSVNLEDYPTNNQVDEKIDNAKKYVDNAIANLTAAGVGGNGKYIKAISETNGVIFAVEETMDITPTNGSDKAITSGAVKKYVDETLENYAKKDGYYETFGYAREAGIAKNLHNDEGKLLDPDVTTSGGTVYADQPFTQRATALTMKAYIDNELITVGSGYEQWKKEQAFSIVRNNKVVNGNFDTIDNWVQFKSTVTIDNNTAKMVATGHTGCISQDFYLINSHKYLICAAIKLTTPTSKVLLYLQNRDVGISPTVPSASNTNWQTLSWIGAGQGINTDTWKCRLQIQDYRESDWDEIQVRNVCIIDLTQWFASRPAIAEALNGDAGVKWFLQNYPQALSLDYDEGTIVDTEDYDYETTGVNLWDEEWELGVYGLNTGSKETNENYIRSKNKIKVFANTKYYFLTAINEQVIMYYDVNENYLGSYKSMSSSETFTTPNNAAFITFYVRGTTYNNNIQICQHFTETSVEQTYHKYETFKDRVSWAFTSTGKGKSAGSVADTKDYVNKKNIEKVGRVDLGTLDWAYNSTDKRFYVNVNLPFKQIKPSELGNILCSKYQRLTFYQTVNADKSIGYYYESSLNRIGIGIKDTSYTDAASFKAAMSGVILNYELATPIETDMSGDEFNTNIPENDYGVERKVPVSGNMFSGSATTIFYQDNPLRQIYNNKSSIDKLQTDLSNEETTRSDTDTALQNAIGGTLRQCLCVKANLDFDNTAFVDLGTLDWKYESKNTVFLSSSLPDLWYNEVGSTQRMICSKYATSNESSATSPDKTIYPRTDVVEIKNLGVKDSAYTDATTFKNAMKGVLLAYEKASE